MIVDHDKKLTQYNYRGGNIIIRLRYGYYVCTTCLGNIYNVRGLFKNRYTACYKAQSIIDKVLNAKTQLKK